MTTAQTSMIDPRLYGLSTDLNYGSQTNLPTICVAFLNTYKYCTRRCYDEWRAGGKDVTFDWLAYFVGLAGYSVQRFLAHAYFTNYIEPIPPANIPIGKLQTLVNQSHQAFLNRLTVKSPKVILDLTGVTSGLRGRVASAAKAAGVIYVPGPHPAFAHTWKASTNQALINAIAQVCRIARI
jgi:hypothetical protein